MGVYDEDIQDAKELIAESGEVSTIRRTTPGVPNPAKPWEPVVPVVTNVQVTAVWLNYAFKSSGEAYTNGSLVKTGDKKVLVAALDLPSGLTVSDQIVREGGELYKIENIKLLDPNGQRILYELQVRQ